MFLWYDPFGYPVGLLAGNNGWVAGSLSTEAGRLPVTNEVLSVIGTHTQHALQPTHLAGLNMAGFIKVTITVNVLGAVNAFDFIRIVLGTVAGEQVTADWFMYGTFGTPHASVSDNHGHTATANLGATAVGVHTLQLYVRPSGSTRVLVDGVIIASVGGITAAACAHAVNMIFQQSITLAWLITRIQVENA